MKVAARSASGVPVSRPRIESCAKAVRSRTSSADSMAPVGSRDGTVDGTTELDPQAVTSHDALATNHFPRGIIPYLRLAFKQPSSRSRRGSALLYICIPVFNEAPTVG